jgi:hypothetical protein
MQRANNMDIVRSGHDSEGHKYGGGGAQVLQVPVKEAAGKDWEGGGEALCTVQCGAARCSVYSAVQDRAGGHSLADPHADSGLTHDLDGVATQLLVAGLHVHTASVAGEVSVHGEGRLHGAVGHQLL